MNKSLLWDKSINLRGGLGYKDNALLSANRSRGSAFAAAGLDAMLFRLPIDGPQFYIFLTGDDYRFLRDIGVDKEQTFIGFSKIESALNDDWTAAFALQYLFQNQVFDVSATEAELTTVKLKGHGLNAAPSLVRKLSAAWQVELELPLNRQFLAEPLDDYWEGGPKLTLERAYGRRSSFALSYAFNHRAYDERSKTDRRGFSELGASLRFHQHEFELANRHHWDDARRWRSDSKLSVERNTDNGSGFFDYQRYQWTEQLRYTGDRWSVRASGRINFYDFSVQSAGPPSASNRYLTALNLTLRGERTLSKSLKWFAEFDHEQNLSNRASSEYEASTILTGLDWEL